jgi:uncharacterized protein YecE (DUF72 family)
MEFGKVKNLRELDNVCFELPKREDREGKLLDHSQTQELHRPVIYMGCPSWSNPYFLGKLYPQTCIPKDYLFYYSQQFNTIELNTTFYRIPDPKTVYQWRTSTPEGFKFCPKVFQQISRFENLFDIPQLTHRFFSSIEHFEDRLGPSFMQLPPHFSSQYFPILRRFLKLIPTHIPLSIEFRHPSWFTQNRLIDPAYDLLRKSNVSAVITDVVGRRDVLHQTLTTQTTLIRFVGNELHTSDFIRIQKWSERLSSWAKDRVGPFYFFIHQPNELGYFELIQSFNEFVDDLKILKLKPLDLSLGQPQLSLF